jgi:hypothetical protein
METSLSGGMPNTCAQLLRRADKEEAMQVRQWLSNLTTDH